MVIPRQPRDPPKRIKKKKMNNYVLAYENGPTLQIMKNISQLLHKLVSAVKYF